MSKKFFQKKSLSKNFCQNFFEKKIYIYVDVMYSNLSVRRSVKQTKSQSRNCFQCFQNLPFGHFWTISLMFIRWIMTTHVVCNDIHVIVFWIGQYFYVISDNLSRIFLLKTPKPIWFSGLSDFQQPVRPTLTLCQWPCWRSYPCLKHFCHHV